MDGYDNRRGHGLGQLIDAYGVVLQRKFGEDHKATEAEGQEEELGERQTFGGKDVQFLADVQAQPGDHEVHQGQAHVGEAVVYIDPFVEEHDADGHQQVEQEPGGDAPVAPDPVRQRCHDARRLRSSVLGRARAVQPPRGALRHSPAAPHPLRAPADARSETGMRQPGGCQAAVPRGNRPPPPVLEFYSCFCNHVDYNFIVNSYGDLILSSYHAILGVHLHITSKFCILDPEVLTNSSVLSVPIL